MRLAKKKLQEDKDVEIIELKHRIEKRILMEKVRELKEFCGLWRWQMPTLRTGKKWWKIRINTR